MSIYELFDFQLQDHDYFSIILWKYPIHENFTISLNLIEEASELLQKFL